jgi:UDP-2,3-diacylglucosamine pyrophosphatase LpxH
MAITDNNTDFDCDRSIFVVSDLHLGHGSSAFVRQGKDTHFLRFLDHVDQQGGQLVVLGDLLELWRFSLEVVLDCWAWLLDRLHQLSAVYIPGNHDAEVAHPGARNLHPLFTRVREPFHVLRGGQRVQFLHGHEIDPFVKGGLHENGLYMRGFQAIFDLRDRMQWLGHEALADLGLGLSEIGLSLRRWVTRMSDQVLHPELGAQRVPAAHVPLCQMRTQRMLSRTLYHRDETQYDVAIVGHTHRVGRFNSWYYNSGCWVKPCNSFLKIHPDARVEIYNWAGSHACPNRTVIG